METDLLLRDFVRLVSSNLQKRSSHFQICALRLDRTFVLSALGRHRIRIDAVTFGNWKIVQHSRHHSSVCVVYSAFDVRHHLF